MLPLILCSTIAFLTSKYGFEDDTETAILFTLVGLALGFFLSFVLNCFVEKIDEKVHTSTLVSLHSGVHGTGDFFLGSGTFDSCPYYFYYVRQKDNGCVLKKKRADTENAIVYEENRTDAVLEIWKRKLRSTLWALDPTDETYTYKFHIPEGSIKRDFSL